MTDTFQTFMARYVPQQTAPLFLEFDGRIATHETKAGKRLLRRHPDFEALMIRTVEEGLQKDDWDGFVYVMHWLEDGKVIPLYIGKAERRGVKHPLSANIANIRKNKSFFGRWGDNRAYHIGDLSHALFQWKSYKAVDPRYPRWADVLLDEPTHLHLRHTTYVTLVPWFRLDRGPGETRISVPLLEQTLISMARREGDLDLLNSEHNY